VHKEKVVDEATYAKEMRFTHSEYFYNTKIRHYFIIIKENSQVKILELNYNFQVIVEMVII